MKTERTLKAFTLIELLVVVGILTILTAIAVPNYKVADTRAKTARVKADLNSLSTAVEAFAIDHSHYPKINSYFNDKYLCSGAWGRLEAFKQITTPIAYMTSVNIEDPFSIKLDVEVGMSEHENSYLYAKAHEPNSSGNHYLLYSYGPRRSLHETPWKMHALLGLNNRDYFKKREYDPSNGTISYGVIMRLQ